MTNTPAGWYPDPEQPLQQRWWDGSTWTDHRQPAPAPAGPPSAATNPQQAGATSAVGGDATGSRPRWLLPVAVLGVLAVVAIVGAVLLGGDDGPSSRGVPTAVTSGVVDVDLDRIVGWSRDGAAVAGMRSDALCRVFVATPTEADCIELDDDIQRPITNGLYSWRVGTEPMVSDNSVTLRPSVFFDFDAGEARELEFRGRDFPSAKAYRPSTESFIVWDGATLELGADGTEIERLGRRDAVPRSVIWTEDGTVVLDQATDEPELLIQYRDGERIEVQATEGQTFMLDVSLDGDYALAVDGRLLNRFEQAQLVVVDFAADDVLVLPDAPDSDELLTFNGGWFSEDASVVFGLWSELDPDRATVLGAVELLDGEAVGEWRELKVWGRDDETSPLLLTNGLGHDDDQAIYRDRTGAIQRLVFDY